MSVFFHNGQEMSNLPCLFLRPSPSEQEVSAFFEDIQELEVEKELQKAIRRYESQKDADSLRVRRGAEQKLENTTKSKEGFEFWKTQDFSDTPIPSALEIFTNLKKIVRSPYKTGSPDVYPIFEPAWAEFDVKIRENLDDQEHVLDETYKQYVNDHTNSSIVTDWTKEDDGTSPTPHKDAETALLQRARLMGGEREPIRRWMQDLYSLVTEAPRCPKMMSFVRTVRHSKRLPSSWFFSINKKKIQKGESVILPTFFSTANLSMDTNYDGHGFYSVSADFDEYPAEANCCLIQVIVSKGVPMLPLGDFLSNDHAHENEILLPPESTLSR